MYWKMKKGLRKEEKKGTMGNSVEIGKERLKERLQAMEKKANERQET